MGDCDTLLSVKRNEKQPKRQFCAISKEYLPLLNSNNLKIDKTKSKV
jgi:hypothetical protein